MQEDKTGRSQSGKKPYEKPEVQFERVFETMALACGKIEVTQGQCGNSRQAS